MNSYSSLSAKILKTNLLYFIHKQDIMVKKSYTWFSNCVNANVNEPMIGILESYFNFVPVSWLEITGTH